MKVGEHDEVDQAFLAGFNQEQSGQTDTPVKIVEDDKPIAEVESKATEPEPETIEDKGVVSESEPVETKADEPEFKITKADYDALLAKAAAIDEFRAEQKQKLDSAFGRIGGLQQIINELQTSTKRGQKLQVSPDHFKELIDEGYTDLAQMTANGFNRILSELNVAGTDSDKPVSQDEINKLFEQRFTPERETLKAELRSELAAEALSDMHEDWQDIVKSDDFQGWVKENKVGDLKDRYGVPFAESIDARFVGKQITAFKDAKAKLEAAKEKQAARQKRIEAAVQPKGTGGHQQARTEDDDFYVGFKGANSY